VRFISLRRSLNSRFTFLRLSPRRSPGFMMSNSVPRVAPSSMPLRSPSRPAFYKHLETSHICPDGGGTEENRKEGNSAQIVRT
jgi:hypothetical protein